VLLCGIAFVDFQLPSISSITNLLKELDGNYRCRYLVQAGSDDCRRLYGPARCCHERATETSLDPPRWHAKFSEEEAEEFTCWARSINYWNRVPGGLWRDGSVNRMHSKRHSYRSSRLCPRTGKDRHVARYDPRCAAKGKVYFRGIQSESPGPLPIQDDQPGLSRRHAFRAQSNADYRSCQWSDCCDIYNALLRMDEPERVILHATTSQSCRGGMEEYSGFVPALFPKKITQEKKDRCELR